LVSDCRQHAERVARFLEYACPDHHIRGGPAHVMAQNAAVRLLRRHPEIARANLYTAVVCGERREVERILKECPQAVGETPAGGGPDRDGAGHREDLFRDLGPKQWEPLLYLCFTRLALPAANDNAVAIASALLDHGANPNVYFIAGDSRYTPLVGVIGEGEESRPPHPRRDELTQLLLERGANPYDIQVFYNIHFEGKIRWYLDLIYAHTLKSGRQADWNDPDWSMIDMGGFGKGARFLLGIAVRRNDLELAEWLLARGANANAALPARTKLRQRSLHDEAVARGYADMARLLERHGATPGALLLDGPRAFTAACLRLDHLAARALLAEHPDYRLLPAAMHEATARDRADVVALLLDLGVSPDVEDPDEGRQRPLHVAAYSDAVQVAELLIERGAAIDAREANFGASPLGFAVWGSRTRMIELLGRVSRDVWALPFTGNVARLREIVTAQPELAQLRGDHETPLMSLPDDEARACQIVELFLANGADPTVRNGDGLTAADLARKRGLNEVAALLERGGAHGQE
jgi:ankyrin repeat protein